MSDDMHGVHGMLIENIGYMFGTGKGDAYEGDDPVILMEKSRADFVKAPENMLEFRDPQKPPTVVLVPVNSGKISKESAAKLLEACASQIYEIIEMTDDSEDMMHEAVGEPIPCFICEAEAILDELNGLVEEYLPKENDDEDDEDDEG